MRSARGRTSTFAASARCCSNRCSSSSLERSIISSISTCSFSLRVNGFIARVSLFFDGVDSGSFSSLLRSNSAFFSAMRSCLSSSFCCFRASLSIFLSCCFSRKSFHQNLTLSMVFCKSRSTNNNAFMLIKTNRINNEAIPVMFCKITEIWSPAEPLQ